MVDWFKDQKDKLDREDSSLEGLPYYPKNKRNWRFVNLENGRDKTEKRGSSMIREVLMRRWIDKQMKWLIEKEDQ